MATHYIKLVQGITTQEIKKKFAAFELLYGESEMVVRGDVPTLWGDKLLPVFGVDAVVIAVGRKIITARPRFRLPEEEDYVIPLNYLYTERPALPPELMFITKR